MTTRHSTASGARWARRAVSAAVAAATVLSGLVLTAPAAEAGHHGGPSARAVAAGQAAVRRREHQVAAAAGRLVHARAALARLNSSAEVAVERYDEAEVNQRAAAAAVSAARLVLAEAARQVDTAQQQVGRFAAAAYMSGGTSSLDAMLTADGPEAMLYRIGTLEVISRSQRDATQSLDAARIYELTLERQAKLTLARAARAARAAADARQRAQAAVDKQRSVLASVHAQRQQLQSLLTQARRHASALERARLAAIARARARAAARAAAAVAARAQQAAAAAAPAVVPTTSSVSGTVSAATEQAALHFAESQIGKPYQWGAAGPDTYDCSGLVMWSYGQVGVTLDHWTGFQWQEGAHIPTSAVRPGDLVFFATNTSDPNTIHHVGMVVGNGEMVEAPYTGANVRISSMWRPDLIGAVRPYSR